jgi:hypothetical protein
MDSTYGASIAIARRILSNELSIITPLQSTSATPAQVGAGSPATFNNLTGSVTGGAGAAAPTRQTAPLTATSPLGGGGSSSFLFRPFGKEKREASESDQPPAGKGEPIAE